MTTRNTRHAEMLASIASQVVARYRDDSTPRDSRALRLDSLAKYRTGELPATATSPPTFPARQVDESWSYTLPKEYQA